MAASGVAEVNVTVEVCFETRGPFQCAESATFTDQFSVTPGDFSDGGDSGSLIVTDDGNQNPVGLLFAGSADRTIANPIDEVLDRFGVSIDPSDADDEPEPDPDPEEGSIEGTVSDADTGSGIDGATVAVEETDLSTTTGSDGSYTLDEVPEGTHDITASATGYESQTETVNVDAGEVTQQDFALEPVEVAEEPVIDVFDVTTRSSGPWDRANVEWAVSHEDGALAEVTSELLDADGSVLDSETSSVSGSNASGEHELRTRSGDPATVRVTVTDIAGNTTVEDKPVTF